MRRISSLVFVFLIAGLSEAQPQNAWKLTLGIAVPQNVPLPLLIKQAGRPEIKLTAHYSSKPLEVPVCWVWRIAYWSGRGSWELQAIHHKLFLDNRPSEVEEFSVSHGLNIVTINRGWKLGDVVARVGAGITIAHPENVVRGQRLPENGGILGIGYYVSGPTLAAGIERDISLIDRLFMALEGMITASYAVVPVSSGRAYVWNASVQANLELGYSLAVFAHSRD